MKSDIPYTLLKSAARQPFTTGLPLQKPARRTIRVLALVLCIVLCIGLPVSLLTWLVSKTRHTLILARQLSCVDSSMPWWLFADQSHYHSGTAFSEMYSLDAANNSASVAHLQLCSRAYKANWQLLDLLDTHKGYAARHGIRYILDTGGGNETGVWRKVEALRETIETELIKGATERLSWIFYSDVDTLVVNPLVSLESFLPPTSASVDPFLLISRDAQGLNFGSFFLKVDSRSVRFLQEILDFPRHSRKLTWKEQSVAMILVEVQQLAEKGELVYFTSALFNSYAGHDYYDRHLPLFLLHFPSWPFKERGLLPMLEELREGKLIVDLEELAEQKTRLLGLVNDFWQYRFVR